MKQETVTLYPVAMRVPQQGANTVYQHSKLLPTKTMLMGEFFDNYYPHAKTIRFCPLIDETNIETIRENAYDVIAYGLGFDCWYIRR